MSHAIIIIKGNSTSGEREIEVTYTPTEDLSGDDAREEATKWSRWVKRQYNYPDETPEEP